MHVCKCVLYFHAYLFEEHEVEALVKELDECVQLDCPIEPVCDDTEESAWTKRTERQEEKWSSLRPKLMEETLTYLGCADPNVSH